MPYFMSKIFVIVIPFSYTLAFLTKIKCYLLLFVKSRYLCFIVGEANMYMCDREFQSTTIVSLPQLSRRLGM